MKLDICWYTHRDSILYTCYGSFKDGEDEDRYKMPRSKRLVNISREAGSLLSGVNFINILPEAFTPDDPKSAKKYSQAVSLFALLGSACINAAHKMLVKSPQVIRRIGFGLLQKKI